MDTPTTHSEASATPSEEPESQTKSFFPPPFRLTDGPSPTKRPRLASRTPSRPPSRGPSMAPSDVNQAREASALRLLDAWASIAEKYTRNLEDDDEVDLETGRVITDRGFLRKAPYVEFGHFIEPEEPDKSDNDEEATEDDVDELDAFSEVPQVAEWSVPPVREVDPLDAKELAEFLAIEKSLQTGYQQAPNETDEIEDEDEAEGQYTDDLDDRLVSANSSKFPGRNEHLSRSSDNTDLSSRTPSQNVSLKPRLESTSINNTPTVSRATSSTLSRQTACASRAATEADSDDEFGAWVDDDASRVYRIPKATDSSNDHSSDYELDDLEFAESPPPSSSVPPSPVKEHVESVSFIDLTIDDDDDDDDAEGDPYEDLDEPPSLASVPPEKISVETPVQLATPPRSSSFAESPPIFTAPLKPAATQTIRRMASIGTPKSTPESTVPNPKSKSTTQASSSRLQPEVVIPLPRFASLNSFKAGPSHSRPPPNADKVNHQPPFAFASTSSSKPSLPTPPPFPDIRPRKPPERPPPSRKGKEREVSLDDLPPLGSSTPSRKDQLVASLVSVSKDASRKTPKGFTSEKPPTSPKTPSKKRPRSPTLSPKSPSRRHSKPDNTPNPPSRLSSRSRSLPRRGLPRVPTFDPPQTLPAEPMGPPFVPTYPPPPYGVHSDPRFQFILNQAFNQMASIWATDYLPRNYPPDSHYRAQYPPSTPSLPSHHPAPYPYYRNSPSSSSTSVPLSSASPETSLPSSPTKTTRPGALVTRSRSRGRRVSFHEPNPKSPSPDDSPSASEPRDSPDSQYATIHMRKLSSALQLPSPESEDAVQSFQRGRTMERGQTPAPVRLASHPRRSGSRPAAKGGPG